jgi:tetratricopeptide (TPR) repeat protein
MDLLLAEAHSDALEAFSTSAATFTPLHEVLQIQNQCASLLSLGLNRRCVKEATRGLSLCSSSSDDPLLAIHQPKLLLFRGVGNARLRSSAGSAKALNDWNEGFNLVTSSPCRIFGDVFIAKMLHSLSKETIETVERGADAIIDMLSTSEASSSLQVSPSSSVSLALTSTLNALPITSALPPTPRSAPAPPSAPLQRHIHTSKLDYSSIDLKTLSQVSSNLSHATIDPILNKGIALGYLQVNTSNYVSAIETFDAIIKDDARCSTAYVGRGSAKAMQGDLVTAFKDFTLATKHAPDVADAWKRRGQTLSALDRADEAIEDLQTAVRCMERQTKSHLVNPPFVKGKVLIVDPDVYNQLGNILSVNMVSRRRALPT